LQFGEKLPCAMGDAKLTAEMYRMKNFLQSLSDDAICNMPEDNDTKRNSLIGLYAYLVHVTHYRQPWLVGSLSLRMVELTMKTSLNAMSPLALAHFGGVLVSAGCITEGCRFGEYVQLYYSIAFIIRVSSHNVLNLKHGVTLTSR